MQTSHSSVERRRYPRFMGDAYPLRLGRHSGQLVDWSAGGVAVCVREGIDDYDIGAPVTISIPSEHTLAVAVFHGHVQRIDRTWGIIGVEFVDDGEDAVRLLIDLVGTMLPHGTHGRRTLS